MGRKIPAKKHRTVKDPYKQQQKRLESIRLKINNPPSNSDEQPMPKRLLKIVELKQKAKKEVHKNRKTECDLKKNEQNKKSKKSSAEENTKKTPTEVDLSQKPYETTECYLKRLDYIIRGLMTDFRFAKKFGVEVQRDLSTGQVEVKKIKNEKKSKKKKLCEKRKEKILAKQENLNNDKNFNELKDKVEFGEVVHRPPNLPALKKANKSSKVARNQRYNNLLLKNVLDKGQNKSTNKISDLQKEKAENARKFIVEAYRKAKKVKGNTGIS